MVELYNIYTTVYYDNQSENYIQIVCINKLPKGELKNYVKRLNYQRLSEFQQNNCNEYFDGCIYAILSLNNDNNITTMNRNCSQFLNPNNIEELYEFLINNNYSINYEFTNLINKSKNKTINNKKLLMYISHP
jgi:hypothetical protein